MQQPHSLSLMVLQVDVLSVGGGGVPHKVVALYQLRLKPHHREASLLTSGTWAETDEQLEASHASGSLHVASLGFLPTWSLWVALLTQRLASPRISVPQDQGKSCKTFSSLRSPRMLLLLHFLLYSILLVKQQIQPKFNLSLDEVAKSVQPCSIYLFLHMF